VRRTGDGGERSSAAAIGVERLGVQIGGKERSGEHGVERWRWGAFYRARRRCRGGEEAGGGGVLIPISFKSVMGKRRPGSSSIWLPVHGGEHGKLRRMARQHRAGRGGSGVR
jgi:hypothetical protein